MQIYLQFIYVLLILKLCVISCHCFSYLFDFEFFVYIFANIGGIETCFIRVYINMPQFYNIFMFYIYIQTRECKYLTLEYEP